MRYTTIIDISTIPRVYTNSSIRLLYLHACLRSGYEDTDRDFLRCSIRTLAADVGITISATRHALKVLQAAGLMTPTKGGYMVAKFVQDKQISKRARTKKQQQEQDAERERQLQDEARERAHEENRRRAVSTEEMKASGHQFTGALARLNQTK